MARKKASECKHEDAPGGGFCPDCGTDTEDLAFNDAYERLKARLSEEFELVPKSKKPAANPDTTLLQRVRGEK